MEPILNRRSFLVLVASATAASAVGGEPSSFPPLLDHVLLGCSDLQRGIDFVEQQTGVRAAFGGVHPGRGTQNALLSLGERHYLEVIAPDPKQSSTEMPWLEQFAEPRLVGWAAHPADLDALARRLQKNGISYEGPRPGSRKTPDGRTLAWKTLTVKDYLKENPGWLLPFVIEWAAESIHPSVDAPKGCELVEFATITPKPDELKKAAAFLGVELQISEGEKAALHARIHGPKGELTVTS